VVTIRCEEEEEDPAMRVEVRLQRSDERLRHEVEQRVRSHVRHLEPALRKVTACLSTLPTGRHCCRLLAHPLPWATVVVEEDDGDVYAAIDRASSRLEETIRVVTRVAHPGTADSSAATPV
jgi:ribosome-associated translation inhibitor RaiA